MQFPSCYCAADSGSFVRIPSFPSSAFYRAHSVERIPLSRGPHRADSIGKSITWIRLYGFYCADSIVRHPSCEFHCADFIVRIPSCGIHRAVSIVRYPLCEFHRADSIVRIPSCGFHCVDYILRIPIGRSSCSSSISSSPWGITALSWKERGNEVLQETRSKPIGGWCSGRRRRSCSCTNEQWGLRRRKTKG